MPRALETIEERVMRYFEESTLEVGELMLRLVTKTVRSKRPTVAKVQPKKKQTRSVGGQGGVVARAISENVAKPEVGPAKVEPKAEEPAAAAS